MKLEMALHQYLSKFADMNAYWMERLPEDDQCIVYKCLSFGIVEGNLKETGIRQDTYSFTIYHVNPDKGREVADALVNELSGLSGEIRGYPIQFIDFNGGFDRALISDKGRRFYQFNRDFSITH